MTTLPHRILAVLLLPGLVPGAAPPDKSMPGPAAKEERGAAPHLQHDDAVGALVFAPHGRWLASGSEDRTIRIWDTASGRELHRLEGHRSRVSALAVSPDGHTLASGGGDKTIYLWDPETGKPLSKLEGHQAWVMALAFAPDGKTLASASYDQTVRLWDVATGKERHVLSGHDDAAACVSFSPDGKAVASGGYDHTVYVWEVASGKERHQFPEGRRAEVTGVAYCAGGRFLATATSARMFRLREADGGTFLRGFRTEGSNLCLACSGDGKTLALGQTDCLVELVEAATGSRVHSFEASYLGPDSLGTPRRGVAAEVRSLALSPSGTLLAAGLKSGRIQLWKVANLLEPKSRRPDPPDPAELESLWIDLGTFDAARAYRALALLVKYPEQSLPFLGAHFTAVREPERREVLKWVARFDDDHFSVREEASRILEQMLPGAEPVLRQALEGPLSVEARSRVQRLLEPLEGVFMPPEQLRTLRAVQVLEQIDRAEAARQLRALARGQKGAFRTAEAARALERLGRKGPDPSGR